MLYASVTRYGRFPCLDLWGGSHDDTCHLPGSPGWLADPVRIQLSWLMLGVESGIFIQHGSEMDS